MLYRKVRIRGRNREGIVLEARNGFAKILAQGEIFWYPLGEIEEAGVIDRLARGELDSPIDFILAMDAYRLSTEYKFNPYVLASSTRVEIFPHQIDEVTLMLDRPRILLADEVGLGKTIVAALVASELAARGLVKRMLFAVPKALVSKWLDELRERFEIRAEFLDSAYLKIHGNPFGREEFCFVASMDTLKQKHFLELLENASIDLVVVDEAHKLSRDTDRFDLGKVLAKRSKYMYFLTATPHRGDNDDFIARLRLLDPYITDIESARHLIIRNLKDDVVTLDGKEVFPPRESRTVEVLLSREELEIHEMLDEFIAKKLHEAKLRGDSREINSARFLGIVLRKRASSSLHALKISLENRLRKTGYGTAADIEKIIKELKEAEEEFDEEERDKKEQELLGRLILPGEFREIQAILGKIDEIGDRDSKLKTLLEWIERIKSSDRGAKIVVFTEYRDTLTYLSKMLSRKYRVANIDGSMHIEDRKRALEQFRDPNGAEIMVCTDAAGEGIDMQFCNIEINYDLPWNPARLEQRMGRIHRIGQNRKVFYYNFVLKGTLDGYILSKLLDKMGNIREALGDRVYDVLGMLVSEKDLNELFEELLRTPRETWEAGIRKLDNIVEKRKEILEKIDNLLAGHKLDRTKLEDMRKIGREAVDENEVKRFVEVFVNSGGGRVRRIEDEIYEIVLPREIAHEMDRGVIRGTFSREVALRTTYPYLALGNRAVMSMIKAAMKESVSVFRHPYFKGLVFFFRVFVIDGRGRERFGRFVGIAEDGSVVSPRIVWDLEPGGVEDRLLQPGKVVEIAEKLEKKILEIASSDAENTLKKLNEIREKSKSVVISFYSREIEKLEERAREYERRVAEAPYYGRLLESTRARMRKLRDELNEKLKEIDEIYSLTPFYELVGIAYIMPFEDHDAKRDVELAGMKAAMKYEYSRAQTEDEKSKIRDVSHEFRGYDIESFDRVIEVKSFKTTGAIELTSNEWIVASRLGDYYWLYVVENALENPSITPIRNPVKVFGDVVVKVPRVEYRYVIENWKEVVG